MAPAQLSGAPEPSPAIAKAKEFVADIFRRAKEAKGSVLEEARLPSGLGPSNSRCRPSLEPPAPSGEVVPRASPPAAEPTALEPGYINYTKLHYVLQSGEGTEPEDGEGLPGTGSGMGRSQEDRWPAPTFCLPPQSLRMTRSLCPLW